MQSCIGDVALACPDSAGGASSVTSVQPEKL